MATTAELVSPDRDDAAARLFVLGGIGLILAGLLFGDIFAVFILHPNADRVGGHLLAATRGVAAGDTHAVLENFTNIGALLENRGTKVDAHLHVIAFGYLALVLALLQPWVAISTGAKRNLARLFLFGATLLPPAVFAIHYVGLAYSPLSSIGWASIVADFGGLLVILACAGELVGLWRHMRAGLAAPQSPQGDPTSRLLLAGGTLLVLAGFLYGAWYAGADLYDHEARDTAILRTMMTEAADEKLSIAEPSVADYGMLQGEKAVKIAAHAHIIEFGLLAMLLAFLQPHIFLSERWRRRWAWVLLAGSFILPFFVLMELRWGLAAGGIADLGGFLVMLALAAMLAGVLRQHGREDAAGGAA